MILVVGAVFVGYEFFDYLQKESVRDSLGVDLASYAREAYAYHHRPKALGGVRTAFSLL